MLYFVSVVEGQGAHPRTINCFFVQAYGQYALKVKVVQPINPRWLCPLLVWRSREFSPESLGIRSTYGFAVQGPIGMPRRTQAPTIKYRQGVEGISDDTEGEEGFISVHSIPKKPGAIPPKPGAIPPKGGSIPPRPKQNGKKYQKHPKAEPAPQMGGIPEAEGSFWTRAYRSHFQLTKDAPFLFFGLVGTGNRVDIEPQCP